MEPFLRGTPIRMPYHMYLEIRRSHYSQDRSESTSQLANHSEHESSNKAGVLTSGRGYGMQSEASKINYNATDHQDDFIGHSSSISLIGLSSRPPKNGLLGQSKLPISSTAFSLTPTSIVFANPGCDFRQECQTSIIREGTTASMELSNGFVGNGTRI
ncbi:hypothetical protein BCON_0026g00010 [Botryotinia convoluta]|uniref:Uncharacterized protein n=1 Tax=Botryotinia convoluta TaxID=54673 RepID=A0A4Z1IYA3_9HELO|nr:hypothetical protein BCON_0026g00010 [Botryotinia convoluta]